MRSFLLAIAVLQILQCSGVPSPEAALRTSLMKLNEMTDTPNLCSVTRRRLRAMYPTGKLTYNLDLAFSVKETTCSKNSGLEFDSPLCRFRPAPTAERGVCRSRVKYFADEIVDVHVHCRGLKSFKGKIHSSESRESNQEVKRKSTESMSKEVESREIESIGVESKIGTAKSREAKARSALFTAVKSRECSRARC
eukprot:gi/632978371/ref/XP_007905874.1/ PREDICTED: secreted phosphoprotein 24-like [Callorhinchus milii]